jgi:hypothetical protein
MDLPRASDSASLCRICSGIPFDIVKEGNLPSAEVHQLTTHPRKGTESSCPFCRFMARAVYDGTPMEEQFRLRRRVEDKSVLLLLTGEKIAVTTTNPYDSLLGVAAAFLNGRYIHFVGNKVGYGRIIINNEVDPKLILSWLQACQSHHDGMCRLPALGEADRKIRSQCASSPSFSTSSCLLL